MFYIREVCEMQDAGTVLAVLRERGRKGLPCDELYRQTRVSGLCGGVELGEQGVWE